jgi:CubicO group peptidase (beta-lactamase class C family)
MTQTVEIDGTCQEQWLPVREAFEQNFAAALEDGASLCITHEGGNVLDLWGGYRTHTTGHPWQEDTIVNVASTTKIMTTLCTLIQVDRGLLDLDEKVSTYWPEFAQGGKESATLRHVLTHCAGVPGLRTPVPNRTLGDWDAVVRLIEKEPAWWPPGTVACYHAQHFGFILGELIRRTSGKGPRAFFDDEVASKIDADFSIGVRQKPDIGRLAALALKFPAEDDDSTMRPKVFASYSLEPEKPSWETISRENPSGNGWGNARSVARVCAVFANGGTLDGVRLLSPALVDEAATEQYHGEELFIGGTIRYGLGFGLHSDEFPSPTPTTFHWGGAGGSWGLMDPACRVSAGYAMNRGVEGNPFIDPRQARIWKALAHVMSGL